MLRRAPLLHAHHHVHVVSPKPILILQRRSLFDTPARVSKPLCLPQSPSPFQVRSKAYVPPPKATQAPPSLQGRSIFRDTSKEKGNNPLWYILAAIVTAAVFTFLEKRRRGLDPMNQHPTDDVRKEDATKIPVIRKTGPVQGKGPLFPKDHVHVVFVLGGPGTGKGTQCEKLKEDWGFNHLSAGELLREEMARPDSEYGELIKKFIQEGEIVPMEITVGLLQNKMQEYIRKDSRKFLIDGFPRKMDQAIAFERNVCEAKIVLYLEGPEEVMVKRLLGRGRSDDNEETIKKRLRVNQRDAEPVVEYYDKLHKLVRVNCNDTPEGVYTQILLKIQAIIEGWER